MSLGVRLVSYQGKDDEHGDPMFKETCRIWLHDGIVHSAGNQRAVDSLLDHFVFAGREYTDEDGEAWLKVMAGTYTGGGYSYLDLFDPDTDEIIRPPKGARNEEYWRWVHGEKCPPGRSRQFTKGD